MAVASSARKPIPAEATRFNAEVQFGDSLGDKGHPISLLARTADPIMHPFWGKNVHDFAGMKIPETIPIDFNHDFAEAIGFANRFDKGPNGLKIDGMLTPFQANDMASEVIFKQKAGVPYQSSIFFDANELVVEEVDDGVTTQVNGKPFVGPGVVFRESVLRGVAVVLYGADRHATSNIKFTASQFAVSMFKEPTVAATNETPEVPVVEAEEEEAPVVEATPTAAAEAAQLSAKKGKAKAKPDGPAFLTAFGDSGGRWFAEGKTFEEAQTLFVQGLKADNERLKTELSEAKKQVTALRGEKEPIEADLSDKDKAEEKKLAELATKMGSPSAAKGALGIKLPV